MYNEFFSNGKFEKYNFLKSINDYKLSRNDVKKIIDILNEKIANNEIDNPYFENIKFVPQDINEVNDDDIDKLLYSTVAEFFTEEFIWYFLSIIEKKKRKKLLFIILGLLGLCVVASSIILTILLIK